MKLPLYVLRTIILAIAGILSVGTVLAQTNEWMWVTGSNTVNSAGSYGTVNVAASSNQPPSRGYAASWTDASGNLWVFGGTTNSYGAINDLWEYNVSTKLWTWIGGTNNSGLRSTYGTQGSPSASAWPSSRTDMAYATDKNGNFWMFGGQGMAGISPDPSQPWLDYESGFLNDVWEFNPTTKEWTWWGGSQHASPANAYGALGAFSTAYNPSGRIFSAMWVDSADNVWIYGGGENSWWNSGNDLWEFNTSTKAWGWINGSQNTGVYPVYNSTNPANVNPGGTAEASYWMDSSGNFWLFGGTYGNASDDSDGQWMYNVASGEWIYTAGLDQRISQPYNYNALGSWGEQGVYGVGTIPPPVYGAATTVDASGNSWIFGGLGYVVGNGGNANVTNNLWSFSDSVYEWAWMSGDSAQLSPSGVYGTQGTPNCNNVPGGRENANLFYQPNGTVWLFGGYGVDASGNTGYLNDLWSYSSSLINTSCTQPPYFTPSSGPTGAPLTVTIKDATAGATIYYTTSSNTNGITPTTNSTVYTVPLNFTSTWQTQTVCAIAQLSGYSASTETCATYWILPQVSAPVITPPSGTYSSAQTVAITDANTSAVIYYTTDGSTPTATSPVYTGSFTVSSSKTVCAVAMISGDSPSATVCNTYTFQTPNPVITPAAGTYTTAQTVAITDSNTSAVIYYTTNGSTPTTSSPVYAGSFTVSSPETVCAIAVASGLAKSSVVCNTYTFPTPTPVITPNSGAYASPLSVSISDSITGAVIYYTTNGSTPTTSSSVYSSALTLTTSGTICAVAQATGYSVSSSTCQTYTVTTPTYTWTPPTTIIYGTKLAGELTATANVAGTWAYSISGIGTVTAATVLPAGQYQLDAVFTAASSTTTKKISIKLTVSPATLTVTATSKSVVYDSQVGSYSYTIAGYVNGDTAAVVTGVPTLTTTATIRASVTPGVVYYTSNAGQYSIKPTWGSLKATNYTFAFVPATLTITPSPTYLTIQPASYTIKQGTAIPTLTYSVKGLLNWDTVAGELSGAATLSTTATKSSAKGTYPITSAAGTLTQLYGNYAGIIYGTGTITIQ